jgi:hypothetical protein
MNSRRFYALVVYAPDWFARSDFWDFISRHLDHKPGQRRIASWHDDPRARPGENSDVFLTVDCGELSEHGYLPEDIEKALLEELRLKQVVYGVIWIQNQPEPEGIF